MEPLLKSDLGTAENQSSNLKDGFRNLGELDSVAVGSTNDDVIQRCISLYESMQEILTAYLTAAGRDAQRIREIGLHFADVDNGMSSEVTEAK